MRVFLTGGAGFLGRHLTQTLLERGDHVIVFDNYATANPENLAKMKGNLQVIKGSVDDGQAVDQAFAKSSPDAVLHLGAIASTGQALKQPTVTARVNLEGTVNILEAMRKYQIRRGLQVSSEETYGAFRYEPCDENHSQLPVSAYGITKVAAERYSDYYNTLYGYSLINVRTSWVYGPGYPRERFETRIIRDALDGVETVLPTGADHRIDFTWVGDFVQGMLRILDAPHLRYRAYNIAGAKAYTGARVAELICERLPQTRVRLGPGLLEYAPGFQMPQKGALDIARAHSDVGYWPTVSFAEGLDRYIAHLQTEIRAVGQRPAGG